MGGEAEREAERFARKEANRSMREASRIAEHEEEKLVREETRDVERGVRKAGRSWWGWWKNRKS